MATSDETYWILNERKQKKLEEEVARARMNRLLSTTGYTTSVFDTKDFAIPEWLRDDTPTPTSTPPMPDMVDLQPASTVLGFKMGFKSSVLGKRRRKR